MPRRDTPSFTTSQILDSTTRPSAPVALVDIEIVSGVNLLDYRKDLVLDKFYNECGSGIKFCVRWGPLEFAWEMVVRWFQVIF
jgi:hypothetical protein